MSLGSLAGLEAGGGVVQVRLRAAGRRGVRGLRPGHEEDGVEHQPHQRQGDQGEGRRQGQGQAVAFHQEQEQGNAPDREGTHTRHRLVLASGPFGALDVYLFLNPHFLASPSVSFHIDSVSFFFSSNNTLLVHVAAVIIIIISLLLLLLLLLFATPPPPRPPPRQTARPTTSPAAEAPTCNADY